MSKDLEVKKNYLPDNIKDLARFVLIGRERLVAVRANIRAVDNVGLAGDVRKQLIIEGQNMAEAILDAEVRLGELFKNMEKGKPGPKELSSTGGTQLSKAEALSDLGFDRKDAHRFETLADNKDLVAQAKKEAKENDDLVTRSEVLRLAKELKRDTDHAEKMSSHKTSKPGELSGKYDVIYADPPWSYGNKQTDGYGAASGHYPTMSIKELCEMPILKHSEGNAVLFMWVTSPLLDECFDVIKAWGYEYKTSFIWDKVKHNMGHYNSVRHEFLLICTRGSMTPIVKKLFDSVQVCERSDVHSEKPAIFREIIETLYPKTRKLELFARSSAKGWETWGNQNG